MLANDIVVKRLNKSFGHVRAVEEVGFEVAAGSFCTILGPSGSGKTTVLRCVAGVETPEEGEISIGGETVFSSALEVNLPPERRSVGMVYQSFALWPHMTVFENVAFPLRVRRRSSALPDQVTKMLETLGIYSLKDRYPSEISGGEQQRTALARALVYSPKVLLLDEPLSSLDEALKDSLRDELKSVQQILGITTLYVTHDKVDALSMSDNLILVDQGKVVSTGPPMELYERPPNSYTASFLSGMLVLEADLVETAKGALILDTPIGRLSFETRNLHPGHVKVGIRPSFLELTSGPSVDGIDGKVRGTTLDSRGFLSARVEVAGNVISVPFDNQGPSPKEGDKVRLRVPEAAVRLLPA